MPPRPVVDFILVAQSIAIINFLNPALILRDGLIFLALSFQKLVSRSPEFLVHSLLVIHVILTHPR